MKYKDYYALLGVERTASVEDIKKAYRKLARKYHPDVSKEADAEERFKEVAEAYQTLSEPEKRAAYDQLGRHPPGDEFQPPPGWGARDGASSFSFDDLNLGDLFSNFGGGRRGGRMGVPGQDFEVAASITLEQAFEGTMLELHLEVSDHDAHGRLRRVPRTFKARIPKGATDGQRLRLRGKGGKGANGGRDGDLYLNIALQPHRFFRATGHDLYLDLPLAPWEAALGASVEVPTLAGTVRLKVPSAAQSGQKLRLAGRGLPRPDGTAGDLFALLQIAMPNPLSDGERAMFEKMAAESTFDPRAHFPKGASS